MEKITIIGWSLVIITMIVFTYIVIRNTIKNERNRKSFSNIMKIGDSVYVPVGDSLINGEILEINGDEVKVIVKVTKSRVYPK